MGGKSHDASQEVGTGCVVVNNVILQCRNVRVDSVVSFSRK
jgi:hypothetical protein